MSPFPTWQLPERRDYALIFRALGFSRVFGSESEPRKGPLLTIEKISEDKGCSQVEVETAVTSEA